MAEEKRNPKEAAILTEAIRLAKEHGSFKATEYLQKQGTPVEVAGYYSNLVRTCYFQEKDVPLMLMLGRAGIQFAHSQGRKLENTDPETASKLIGTAKEMAFNSGANAWPGWEDEGITITTSDLAMGLDLAKLNLRLAKELNRGPEVFGNAQWLVGAQYLAAEQPKEALTAFKEAAKSSAAAKEPDMELMANGYAAITRMTVAATKEQGTGEHKAAVEALRRIGSDDAKFYADQLESVAKRFVK